MLAHTLHHPRQPISMQTHNRYSMTEMFSVSITRVSRLLSIDQGYARANAIAPVLRVYETGVSVWEAYTDSVYLVFGMDPDCEIWCIMRRCRLSTRAVRGVIAVLPWVYGGGVEME